MNTYHAIDKTGKTVCIRDARDDGHADKIFQDTLATPFNRTQWWRYAYWDFHGRRVITDERYRISLDEKVFKSGQWIASDLEVANAFDRSRKLMAHSERLMREWFREYPPGPGAKDWLDRLSHAGANLQRVGPGPGDEDFENCPGCGGFPGDGLTDWCYHPKGCGNWKDMEFFYTTEGLLIHPGGPRFEEDFNWIFNFDLGRWSPMNHDNLHTEFIIMPNESELPGEEIQLHKYVSRGRWFLVSSRESGNFWQVSLRPYPEALQALLTALKKGHGG